MKVEILLTPPLLANLLIAGLVMPSILALYAFLACLFPPTLPIPFPPFPPAILFLFYKYNLN
jgi:hypothetical protein